MYVAVLQKLRLVPFYRQYGHSLFADDKIPLLADFVYIVILCQLSAQRHNYLIRPYLSRHTSRYFIAVFVIYPIRKRGIDIFHAVSARQAVGYRRYLRRITAVAVALKHPLIPFKYQLRLLYLPLDTFIRHSAVCP